jgi:hypothetical protein
MDLEFFAEQVLEELDLEAKSRDGFNEVMNSLLRFLQNGLVQTEIVNAAMIARRKELDCPNRTFRYFCGVCWNTIRKAKGPLFDCTCDDSVPEVYKCYVPERETAEQAAARKAAVAAELSNFKEKMRQYRREWQQAEAT